MIKKEIRVDWRLRNLRLLISNRLNMFSLLFFLFLLYYRRGLPNRLTVIARIIIRCLLLRVFYRFLTALFAFILRDRLFFFKNLLKLRKGHSDISALGFSNKLSQTAIDLSKGLLQSEGDLVDLFEKAGTSLRVEVVLDINLLLKLTKIKMERQT